MSKDNPYDAGVGTKILRNLVFFGVPGAAAAGTWIGTSSVGWSIGAFIGTFVVLAVIVIPRLPDPDKAKGKDSSGDA